MPNILGVSVMAKKTQKDRYELQADPDWFERAKKMAEKLGLSLAAYIRLVVSEDMDRRVRDDSPANNYRR